jgi:hypothetical protein
MGGVQLYLKTYLKTYLKNQKNSLRENGKLILSLSDENLLNMLKLKDSMH